MSNRAAHSIQLLACYIMHLRNSLLETPLSPPQQPDALVAKFKLRLMGKNFSATFVEQYAPRWEFVQVQSF